MSRQLLIVAALLISLSLESCALGLAAGAAISTHELGSAMAIQAVNNAEETREQTRLWPQGNAEAVVAPTWSRGGLAVRLACPSDRDGAGPPEIHIRVAGSYNIKNIDASCEISEMSLRPVGRLRFSWWRYQLGWRELSELAKTGGILTVDTIVGEWSFRMGPGYFRGFYDALAAGYKLAPSPGAPVKS
jgi:post-segregation antitoxin (ccd killing protein)